MAEGALFTIAGKILSTLAAPAFEKAYEKASSVLNAREELDKLKDTIGTIQAGILDAERKQEDSVLVKNWVKRAKEVLYDADDLFDEVATDDLLRRHVKGSNKLVEKVRISSSRLNPFVSNDIANKVKKIRESLVALSNDMRGLHLVMRSHEITTSGIRKEQDSRGSLLPKNVVGRDEDKKAILDFLLRDQSNDVQQEVEVIAIVGIGGMGKTTLAHLVYDHEEVKRSFEKRWFAYISDISDDAQVCGEIYKSMFEVYNGNIEVTRERIKESIVGKKFLLVLDDVWDHDRSRWLNRMSLLSNGPMGSKVIVSTRSESVANAVGASRIRVLNGLSEEESWDLFKSVVSFTREQEEDSKRIALGRKMVKKCANVPLAINCIASLLFEKNSIEEWESISNKELPQLGQDNIMPVLKLSYEHLPSNLKHCFAYCSLFLKDDIFHKEKLIELWIAQSYVNPDNENQTVENEGHSHFMDLVRRTFFQPHYLGPNWYKMHDVIHDLAIHVAGKESLTLTAPSDEISGTRHVSVGYVVDDSWLLPKPLQSVNRLRSLLFMTDQYPGSRLVLGKQFADLKSLRALSLRFLEIQNIPSFIGELKHLRYLDISGNKFTKLPDSISKLVNLCTLNISKCRYLEVLPNNFRKLTNLRHLHNNDCYSLKHMPPGFEELTSLQHLDVFRVGEEMGGGPSTSKLDVLSGLKLRGELSIWFGDCSNAWDGIECWQPPLQVLRIYNYKGVKIPHWGNGRTTNPSPWPHLSSLILSSCQRVKCLPPFRHIPNIKELELRFSSELEYIEEDEVGSDALYIPDLKTLTIKYLPKLKAWSRKVERHPNPQQLSFPNLSFLDITDCPELESLPLCPSLRSMLLNSVGAKQIQQSQLLPISDHTSSPSTSTAASCLGTVSISSFDWLECFPGESLTCLQLLEIRYCTKLKKVDLPPFHLNTLEHLGLKGCPELELWDEKTRGVDWDSLPKLNHLTLEEAPPSERLPDCLLRRQKLGQLKIKIL